jgi:ribosomal protein S9
LNLIRVMPAKGVRSVMSVTGTVNTGTLNADVVVAGGGVIGTAIAWRDAPR